MVMEIVWLKKRIESKQLLEKEHHVKKKESSPCADDMPMPAAGCNGLQLATRWSPLVQEKKNAQSDFASHVLG